jgi:hypothetical protein
MRRSTFLIALALFAWSASFAPAELRFPTPSIDLGEVRAGVPLAHAFTFVNTGPHAVTLMQVQPGCGCLRPHLAQCHLEPGQEGKIPLEVHTLGQAAGPHRWSMTVFYQEGEVLRQQKLEVLGNVVTEVSVQPAAVTLFTDGSLIHEVVLTDLRDQPLTIERVVATSPALQVQATPLTQDASGHWTSRIRIATAGELAPGQHDEAFTIYTSDPVYRELKVAVTVVTRVRQRVTAAPAEVTLTTGPRLVRLRDAQDQPVAVESVTAEDPGVVCSWAAGPDHQATLKLQPDRARLPEGGLRTRVRVQLSGPVREVLTIPVVVTND